MNAALVVNPIKRKKGKEINKTPRFVRTLEMNMPRKQEPNNARKEEGR